MSNPLFTYGALALECPARLPHISLARDLAAELAGHVASDLERLLPGIEHLDLGLAAAVFDPAELLRPGWPVHAALADLVERAPGRGEPRVLGFGTHEGHMPHGLEPDESLREGPLRLLPFVLHGPEQALAGVSRTMEAVLLDTGMAQAATGLFAQQHFGAALEHARYLSLNDLLALTHIQYQHAGLAPLWAVIETALLSPGQKAWLDAPPEPLLHWSGNEARMALMDMSAWAEAGYAPSGVGVERIANAFNHFQMRQSQFAAVLGAHGLPVRFDHVGPGQSAHAIVQE